MKILIIEDERCNADRLCHLIDNIDTIPTEIIGVATNNAEALVFLQKSETLPDVILADILLGDGLSFDALQQAPAHIPVIFTTAYEKYAIQAFKYNGIAYLLKPIDQEELTSALQQVADSMTDSEAATLSDTDQLRELLTALRRNGIRYRERFLIPFRDELKVLSTEELSHIGLIEGRTYLFTNSGRMHPFTLSLEELETQLDPQRFMRVNRQYIVNISAVESLVANFLGKMRLCLKGYPDTNIIISRAKVSLVKQWLDY